MSNRIHRGSLTDGSGSAPFLNNPNNVFVTGNYAYIASAGSNALEIVDVSNPANPVHRGSIVHGSGGALLNNPYSIFVAGNYAYITSAGSNALEIVDVSNPASPVHRGSIVHGSGGALLNNPYGVLYSVTMPTWQVPGTMHSKLLMCRIPLALYIVAA